MVNNVKGNEVLYGKKIFLDAISNDLIMSMSNDMLPVEVIEQFHDGTAPLRPMTASEIMQSIKNTGELVFAVRLIDNDRCVGVASLHSVSWKSRYSELTVGVFDETNYSVELVKDVIQTILQFAYWEANLNRVGINVSEDQVILVDALEQVGFVFEGRLRQHIFRNGNYLDQLTYSILQREWSV